MCTIQECCLSYTENAEKSLWRCFERVTCQVEFHAECMLQGKRHFFFSPSIQLKPFAYILFFSRLSSLFGVK